MPPVARRRAPAPAFTLLELLVALSVFAIATAMAYAGLARLVDARRALAEEQERLAGVLLALGLFERDLRAAVPRAARHPAGGTSPALVGGSSAIEWTRLTAPLAGGSALGRVAYRLEGSRLVLERLPFADRAPGSPALRETLLERVSRLELRYLDAEGRWRPEWPTGEAPLPRAVELSLSVEGLGELRRLVAVGPVR